MTLTDLERRLSEAKEGSHELDAHVTATIFGGDAVAYLDWERLAPAHMTNAPMPEPFHGKHRAWTQIIDCALALAKAVLPGWWLYELKELRTPIFHRGDKHEATGMFAAALQHTDGGRLTYGQASTPALALVLAIIRALKEKA